MLSLKVGRNGGTTVRRFATSFEPLVPLFNLCSPPHSVICINDKVRQTQKDFVNNYTLKANQGVPSGTMTSKYFVKDCCLRCCPTEVTRTFRLLDMKAGQILLEQTLYTYVLSSALTLLSKRSSTSVTIFSCTITYNIVR